MIVVKYASIHDRVSAFLLDIVFVSGISFMMGIFLSLISIAAPIVGSFFFSRGRLFFVNLLVLWIYFAGLESSKHQATFGKMIMGIKVANEKGRRIGFWQATKRFFFKLLSFGLGLNQRGQALHDRMAKCLVMKSQ